MYYLFSIISLLGFYSIAERLNKIFFPKKENIVQIIFIFTLIFYFIYLVLSYLFILNISGLYFSILLNLFSICAGAYFFIYKYKNNLFLLKKNLNNIFVIFFLISFLIISFLLPSDQDSLRYHLEIPKRIIDNNFYQNSYFDYMLIGAIEFINLFGLYVSFENTGSLLSYAYIIFIILSNKFFYENYKIGSEFFGSLIVISSPYLIALIASQKVYLVPCFIVSYSIAYLHIKKNIEFKELLIIITLNIFSFCLKITFYPYLLYIGIWYLFFWQSNIKNKIYLTLFSILIFTVSYFPLIFIKYKIYQDPLLPIVSLNENNQEWFNIFKIYLKEVQMDYTDSLDKLYQVLLVPLKIIFPLTLSDFFKTLGVGMLALYFLPLKKISYLKYIIFFFILSFFVLPNYQTRWIFPLLLIIGIFYDKNKSNWIKNITYLQIIGSLLITLMLSIFIITINFFPNSKIANNGFTLSKKISDEINLITKGEKYFSDFDYFYYQKNNIVIYFPEIQKIFDPDLFNRNKDVRFFVTDDNKGDFKRYINNNTFDYPKNSSNNIFDNANLNCNNSKYTTIKTWIFNSRRFIFFNSPAKISLHKLC